MVYFSEFEAIRPEVSRGSRMGRLLLRAARRLSTLSADGLHAIDATLREE